MKEIEAIYIIGTLVGFSIILFLFLFGPTTDRALEMLKLFCLFGIMFQLAIQNWWLMTPSDDDENKTDNG